MRIVVCDDEPLARERLVRIVQESGHEVVGQADTGAAAITAVKTQQPDIILLDIRMPEMDGVRCAQELANLDHPPAIIFVTAYDQYAIAALKASAIGYLLKPANKDELLDALNKAKNLNAAQLNEMRKLDDPTASQGMVRSYQAILSICTPRACKVSTNNRRPPSPRHISSLSPDCKRSISGMASMPSLLATIGCST